MARQKKERFPAKITRPRMSGVVQRVRLFRLLDAGRGKPVIWVSAPAGAGKTTLIASWIESRQLPCLWYQADDGDGDIATFFYYMGLAAKKAAPRFRRPLPLLKPEYLLGINTFARRYFEELYARIPHPFVLVIDNYQDVPVDTRFHEIIGAGFSLLPEDITAVLISRTDPLPALARMRANGQMHVLGWGDLLFDRKEAAELAMRKGVKAITSEASRRIQELSGGWAAGIVLLTEAATVADDHQPGSLETRSREDIFDYFASEIFQRTDRSTQEFLVSTAFLPKMTERVAEQLSGMPDAGRILVDLSRKNYFIHRSSGPVPAFQYHRLFRDFLRARAGSVLGADQAMAVQHSAASLLLEAKQIEDAVALYDEAGDGEGLARLLVSNAGELMQQGRSRTLQTWLDRIPGPIAERLPWVLFWKGVSRMPTGLPEVRTFLERAFHRFSEQQERAGALLAWASIVDTIIHEFTDLARLDPWIDWLEHELAADPSYPTPEIGFRVLSSMFVANLFRRTRREELRPWTDRAAGILTSIPDPSHRCRLALYLGLDATWTGDLPRLRAMAQDIKQWSRSPGIPESGIEEQYAKYVQTLYEWTAGVGDYGLQAATEALAIVAEGGVHVIEHHLTARAAVGAFCTGDLAKGKQHLDRIHRLAESSPSARMHLFQYHYLPGWHLLLSGDFAGALRDAEASVRLSAESGATAFHQAFSLMVAAHALIALKRPDESHRYLERILEIAQRLESPIIEFSGLLLEGHAMLVQGTARASQKGRERLRKAMELGRKHEYLNTIVWYPPAMAFLCRIALEQGIEEAYVRNLIVKRRVVPDSPPVHLENWPWRFRLYTLSRFAIVKDGRPLRSPGRTRQKPLELLKALIALGAKDVAIWSLVEALWPDVDGDAAQRSFDTTLHRLRTMLGDDEILVLREGKLSLDERFVWIDSRAFDRLVGTAAEAASPAGDRNTAIRLLEKALALYEGHFLREEGGSWAVSVRERLRSKCVRAVMDLGRHREESADWDNAVRVYEQGMEIDDLAEEFYRRIMAIYRDQGRYAEGLSLYKRCREVLNARHGIAPSDETEALYQDLLRKAKQTSP